jgi:FAD:protein FMN transferase
VKRRDFVGALASSMAGTFLPRLPRHVHDDQFVERWSWVMGQTAHVMVFAGSEAEGLDACAATLAELRRVETRLTLFDDASDLCELNRHAGAGATRIDADLETVLRLAEGFRRATDGAFNVAIEPLMRAWGFHRLRTAEPSSAEIAEARDAVASAVVAVEGDRARLPNSHTQLDFGGIAVGYGIDRALGVLRARGIQRALIDVSGDLGALGAPPGESGWPVEIGDPDHAGKTVGSTRLRDAALATSANTESVVRYRARVLGHVMNPVTGWPAHTLRQATVVARTAVEADALSTALFVSGRRPPSAFAVYQVT